MDDELEITTSEAITSRPDLKDPIERMARIVKDLDHPMVRKAYFASLKKIKKSDLAAATKMVDDLDRLMTRLHKIIPFATSEAKKEVKTLATHQTSHDQATRMQIKTHLMLFYQAPIALVAICAAIQAWWLLLGGESYLILILILGAIVISAAFFVAGQILFRLVPARCPVCNGPCFSTVPLFSIRERRITYTCRACGHEHRTEQFVGGG
jgi:hypothetical protein